MVNSNISGIFLYLSVLLVVFSNGCINNEKENGINVIDEGGTISFSQNGKPMLSYNTKGALPGPDVGEVYLRGGYLHPVFTPSGKIITDDYPDNHVHHHGIWAAWTKTEFEGRSPDFWNMGDSTGTVRFVKVDTILSGDDFKGIHATHQYVDLTSAEEKVVLEERWEVKVYENKSPEPSYYLFDLNIYQNCVTENPLTLPLYHYGGLGFRGPENWNGANNTDFLSSEGKTRENGNETRARWCHVGGLVKNEFVGIAILNHNDNFRFPQPVRIHPNEPFFCYAPSQLGTWEISPQNQYVAKYRFVVYDGKPDTALLEELWKEYSGE